MNSKYMLMVFVAIFTGALCAMNTQSPSSVSSPGSSQGPQSPGEMRMRQQHLVRRLGQQINPAIYRVLPRAHVVPPHLNAPMYQIVNDWFFDHLTSGQVEIINRIARAITGNTRATLMGTDVQLYLGFPVGVEQELRPYVFLPEMETAPTEIDTSNSQEALSQSKKRKK